VAVRAEAEVDQVEPLGELRAVAAGGGVEVVVGDRHRSQPRLEVERQRRDQVSEVAVGVAGRRHPLVDLEQRGAVPGNREAREQLDHPPGRLPPAQRDRALATLGDRVVGGCGDQLRRAERRLLGISGTLELEHRRA
jgi:hypothetical protein